MLVPSTVLDVVGIQGAQYLPLAGKLGCLPIYSTQTQINTSENGKEELKQNLVRYICLYPHAGMMLRLSVIDPPSVEFVVSILKALERDKDFGGGLRGQDQANGDAERRRGASEGLHGLAGGASQGGASGRQGRVHGRGEERRVLAEGMGVRRGGPAG